MQELGLFLATIVTILYFNYITTILSNMSNRTETFKKNEASSHRRSPAYTFSYCDYS